jgi:glutamine synthetase
MDNSQPSVIEYVWLDHDNQFRSKTRIMAGFDPSQDGIPIWNYDGSSTKQAIGTDSEVFIRPVSVCFDPFRGSAGNSYIALCDTWIVDKEASKKKNKVVYIAHPDNTRAKAKVIFDNKLVEKEEPWFGFEQEFFFTTRHDTGDTKRPQNERFFEAPVGMTTFDGKEWISTSGKEQGDFYCGIGPNNINKRNVAEYILNCLILSEKIHCTGYNWEVAPGQCEFQIFGQGIRAADSLLLFRYIAQRAAEIHNISINFHPKPMTGDWNGSGCHTNFSTASMRAPNSYDSIIKPALKSLKKNHKYHIENYGKHNKQRLTGEHETASWETFTAGVANRGASVRVPTQTYYDKSGYIEDRRPSSNMDPYLVSSLLVNTVVLKADSLPKFNDSIALEPPNIEVEQ